MLLQIHRIFSEYWFFRNAHKSVFSLLKIQSFLSIVDTFGPRRQFWIHLIFIQFNSIIYICKEPGIYNYYILQITLLHVQYWNIIILFCSTDLHFSGFHVFCTLSVPHRCTNHLNTNSFDSHLMLRKKWLETSIAWVLMWRRPAGFSHFTSGHCTAKISECEVYKRKGIACV